MDDTQREEVFGKIKKHYPNVLLMPDPDKPWGEQPDEFKALFGVPEDKTGYKPPEDFKGLPDDVLGGIMDMAHEAGLNRKQWETVAHWFANGNEAQQQMMLEASEANEGKVKAVLGLSYQESNKGVELMAKQFQDETYPVDLDDPMTQAALNNPAIKLMLNNIRKNALSGEAANGLIVKEGEAHKTPRELQDEWNDMERSEENKLFMNGQLPADRKRAHMDKRMRMREAMNKTN
jgi:hypothetical protein